MNIYQQYRRDNGLCLDCNEVAAPGKTRCYRCLQIIAVKQRERYHERMNDPEYKKKKREYQKRWKENHPEKMEVYKARKSMYNRKYFYGEEI
jgi:hypothetical protein